MWRHVRQQATGFLMAGDLLGNAPIGSPFLFGHFPKCLHYSVGVAEKVSNIFWAFSKESPIEFLSGCRIH
jgi:hypothetical protein